MGNGCHVTLVERNVGVCPPSIPSFSQSVGEDQSRIGRYRSSSTVVAKKSLVTRPTGVERGAALGAPTFFEKLLMQPKSHVYHLNLQVLWLHAWRLLIRVLDLPDYQRT